MFLSNVQNNLAYTYNNRSFDLINDSNYNTVTLNQAIEHDTLTDSIERALEYLLDDSLFAFASAQLMIQNSTIGTPVTISVRGTCIGTSGYIYGLFAFNSLLVLILV